MAFLNRLFGRDEQRKAADAPPPLSSAVSQTILSTVGSRAIPPMPGAAARAFQLATDPNAEARDFVEVIESDESLASRVIKIANSVYFDRGQKSSTIEDCVLVIGTSELRNLLNASSLSEIFPSSHPARTQLWANDIATALISRSLAARVMPGKEGTAFLAGLMHDVGKLLLLQRNTEDYVRILQRVETGTVSFQEAEAAIFPFDHCEAGQLVAERWHFPEPIVSAIRLHHTPPAPATIPGIVHAADIVAHSLGLGHPKTFFRFQAAIREQVSGALEALKIPEAEQPALINDCRRTFEMEYDLYAGTGRL